MAIMQQKIKVPVLVLIALLLISCLTLRPANVKASDSSRTITVPDDFPTIQEALGNATAGDTIYVKKGTYTIPPNGNTYEMEIPNSVSLIGENPKNTIIETTQNHRSIFGWNYGIALYDNASISGFTITGNVNVIFMLGNGRITNNIINVTANGSTAIEACSGTISSNILNGGREGMISYDVIGGRKVYGGNTGISSTTGDTLISNNVIRGFGMGIYVGNKNLKVLNNSFTNNGLGIFIGIAPALLLGNNFEISNGCELYADWGTNATYNWWGTNDPQAVSRAITTTGYDTNKYGKVIYEPFLTSPNPQAIPIQNDIISPISTPATPEYPLFVIYLIILVVPISIFYLMRKQRQTCPTKQQTIG
jgi:hypothetical protein